MTGSAGKRKIEWGILGTARIAVKVGRAIQNAVGARLSAVASRDRARAANWIAEHAFDSPSPAPAVYGSYEDLLADPSIDAVYIPLPPSLHAEWTIKAAECGKHVLCEKPLATRVADARAMAAACHANGVQLMDGVMWMHHERTIAMKRALQEGALGTLRRVTTAFSFNATDFAADNIRFQRDLGGGVLGDIGWYCVGATLWAFESLPTRVFATARYRDDVERSLSAILWFADDRIASFDCAFDTTFRKWMEIAGTEGSIVCDDFANPWDVSKARFWVHDRQGKASQENFPGCVQEVRMIECFTDIVRSERLEPEWVERTINTQIVCSAIDFSARTETLIELNSIAEH
jgi:predicted dehydrogenase